MPLQTCDYKSSHVQIPRFNPQLIPINRKVVFHIPSSLESASPSFRGNPFRFSPIKSFLKMTHRKIPRGFKKTILNNFAITKAQITRTQNVTMLGRVTHSPTNSPSPENLVGVPVLRIDP